LSTGTGENVTHFVAPVHKRPDSVRIFQLRMHLVAPQPRPVTQTSFSF
jgi:hypothetical protein